MPSVKQETTNQVSTTSYMPLLTACIIGFPKCTVVVTNSDGVNGIKYKILVSNHKNGASSSYAEDKAEATLAAGSVERHVVTGCFGWVCVKIIDASAGDHGIGNAWLTACGV